MKGKPTRESRRIQMPQNLANDGGFVALKWAAEDREVWRHRERMSKTTDDDGYCTKEIQTRIEMAKKVFTEKKKLFTGKMNLELKKRIMKCSVWSVTCAVETWMLTQTHRRRLEAFEMMICRRIEKISCLDKVTKMKFSGETQRKDVKNLLYSRRLLLVQINQSVNWFNM